jgi:hypothetical protein
MRTRVGGRLFQRYAVGQLQVIITQVRKLLAKVVAAEIRQAMRSQDDHNRHRADNQPLLPTRALPGGVSLLLLRRSSVYCLNTIEDQPTLLS